MNVLFSFKKILESCEVKGFNPAAVRNVYPQEVDGLCSLYDISHSQCLLLAAILELDAYCGASVVNLAATFQCKTVDIYMLMDDIEVLVAKGYLYLFNDDPEVKFRINPAALKAFRQNKSLDLVVRKCDCTKELADQLVSLYRAFAEGNTPPDLLRRQLVETVQANNNLPLGNNLSEIAKSFPAIEFMAVVLATVNWVGDASPLAARQLFSFCSDAEEERSLRAFLANKNGKGLSGGVVSAGIIQVLKRDSDGLAETMVLTEGAKHSFWEHYAKSEQSQQNASNSAVQDSCSSSSSDVDLLRPVLKHPVKELFLDDDEQSQYEDLVCLLQQDRMKEIRRSLRKSGLNSGFTCLFYGPPGTGKTETAYQIGLATGRDIYQADMSLLHGKWVGDSERHAQQLFDQYFNKILHSKIAPILLLNEADAIISPRLVNADTSVGLMYNRVQNILLQALEDFQGILIATTNLEQNFDSAFERRFLYKMHFRLPSPAVRARIWKSMLASLSDEDCRRLADEFPTFAGGHIANVSRKALIEAALHGCDIGLERIRELCRRETIADDAHPIGFRPAIWI